MNSADNNGETGTGRDELGRFAPGPGNKGRPKNSINKIAAGVRLALGEFLFEKLAIQSTLNNVYEGLTPREKARFIVDLSKFFVPVLKEVSSSVDSHSRIDFIKLSQGALKEVLDAATIENENE